MNAVWVILVSLFIFILSFSVVTVSYSFIKSLFERKGDKK